MATDAPLPAPSRGLLFELVEASLFLMGQTKFQIELEQEEDGRWIAEVPDLPGVLAYGSTREEAMAAVQALALRVLADRLEHGEAVREKLLNVSFIAA
jgi:predicted RNase H-like HicB family nuclease